MSDLQVLALYEDHGPTVFTALIDEKPVTTVRYQPGDSRARLRAAVEWSKDPRLGGLSADAIIVLLEQKELEVLAMRSRAADRDSENQTAGYADADTMVELCWIPEHAKLGLAVYDIRGDEVEYCDGCTLPDGRKLTPPQGCKGIVTPGGNIDGSVLVPTRADFEGDVANLRGEVRAFIGRYVELDPDSETLCCEYVFLSWCYASFDELPYLAFRTADAGSGKSRALETVGALCYLPLVVGGGSSAAATLRLLDTFRGTLVADEFDAKDSELGSELTRILNQGFQSRRPLIKCIGENNEPQAFSCFGPKIFAFRQRMGDDATESRIVAVRMQGRTRDDIPINLPRARFDREALAIRNKLLAWRFRHSRNVRIDPGLADDALEDRHNQIGIPLLSVAPDHATRDAIRSALRGQQAAVADQRADSFVGSVFAVCMALGRPGDIVRPCDVAAELNRRAADDQGVTVDKLKKRIETWTAAKAFRTLELPRAGRDARGVRYLLDPNRVAALAKRYGRPVEPTLHTHPTLGPDDPTLYTEPGQPDPDFQAKNAENVGCVGSVGSQASTPPGVIPTPNKIHDSTPNLHDYPPDGTGWARR